MHKPTATFVARLVENLPKMEESVMQDWTDNPLRLRTFLLGLSPSVATSILDMTDQEIVEATVLVDRKVPANFPSWAGKVLHPELEETGPAEWNAVQAKLSQDPDQSSGNSVQGEVIFRRLESSGALPICAGLRDLEEIEKKGLSFYQHYWKGKSLYAWKSVFYRGEDPVVPFLIERSGKLLIDFRWLGDPCGKTCWILAVEK